MSLFGGRKVLWHYDEANFAAMERLFNEDRLKGLKHSFNTYDLDGDGSIIYEELQSVFKSYGLSPSSGTTYLSPHPLSTFLIQKFFLHLSPYHFYFDLN